jgi:hypothetical protein
MNRLALPCAALLLSATACAPMPPAGGPPPGGMCNAAGAKSAIGRAPTPDVVERARVDSGSATVRVIRPGDVVTMDFRGDRLNLDVNDRDAITGARCG